MHRVARGTTRGEQAAPKLGIERVLPWVVRLFWVGLPFTAGPALGAALDDASRPVQLVASIGLWAAWAVGVAATFVPLPVSLTALRVLAPASLAAGAAAALAGHASALALAWSGAAAGWIFHPDWGARCVNGPAYPNERRFLLRCPGTLLFGPLALAWALAMCGVAAGPLLLAAKQWLLGAVLTVIGLPFAAVLLRGMHDLSRRWAVTVPAGLVLHDPLTVVDPVLLRRQSVTRLRPAIAGTDALDLTRGALGLTLELELGEPVTVNVTKPRVAGGEATTCTALLFTPTRPGAVLDEARSRRLPT